jgi:4-hydroxybenzoate polyprenyltransferase
LRSTSQRQRIIVGAFALASLCATLFYLAYYFSGSYGMHFGSLHYYKMWWPLWTIAAAVGIWAVGVQLQKTTSRRTDDAARGRP